MARVIRRLVVAVVPARWLSRRVVVPRDGWPLVDEELSAFVEALCAWQDKAGTKRVAHLERLVEGSLR